MYLFRAYSETFAEFALPLKLTSISGQNAQRKRSILLFLFCKESHCYFCSFSDKINGEEEVFFEVWKNYRKMRGISCQKRHLLTYGFQNWIRIWKRTKWTF